ncbi:MAG: NAD(P)(+) transhydrogenase (Re/Si-specific) subunit beta [Candidatus Krumholzibacteriota bacterium]|nr:NAD(P)(+) transhydrogenase (Re/Si-specific) subunit beta [Candidatus Krumholzibacteriota bacterium]
MQVWIINLAYLIASVMFIIGLKGLTHPRTAVRGNLIGAMAMLLAVGVTLFNRGIIDYKLIFAGVVVGSAIGATFAVRVPMTGIPQMVALFNGFGGAASVFVAGAALIEATMGGRLDDMQLNVAIVASGLIGGVTFWGSLVAFAKLQELKIIPGGSMRIPGVKILNALLGIVVLVLAVMIVRDPANITNYWILVAVSSVLGVTLTVPIGGADMPVVIALLNSYSGLAAAATGFVLSNNVLIIAGSLVGASGLILTNIMCKAMNRSLGHVLFGTFEVAAGPAAEDIYAGKVKATSPEELSMILETAQRVVFVPGYGMAVAQAQHAVRELGNTLEARGTKVEYAIHPVAGRMPGHMNVLLAEANVDYDKLIEMDVINPTMDTVDVCIVIGANDVINPAAREPDSAIAGMPIIDVDRANTVIIIKRSLSPGFAGIPNPLFAADNALMLFGDGKKMIMETLAAIKEAA